MKKKLLFSGIGIIVVFLVIFFLCQFNTEEKVVLMDKHVPRKRETSAISLMYETEAGSGIYEATTDSSFSPSGYKFNATLSKCENGSTLSYDEETGRVMMQANKSDKCYIYFDKLTISEACQGQNIGSCLATNYALDNSLYLHDSTLANSANDGSYRYAGGDYQLTSTATSAGYTTLLVSSSSATGGLIDFYCNGSKQYVGDSCSTSYTYYYTVAGSGSYTTYQSALDAGVSQGYLTSDNVKNFVCFGTDAETCPVANLYRIIGVIDGQVKLIKYDYANTDLLGTDGDYSGKYTFYYSGKRDLTTSHYWYYWNNVNYSNAYNATGYYNVWSYSALNTVNLNTNYINNIGTTWANKIATTTWKVGGATYDNVYSSPVTTAYQNEIVNPNADVETEYSTKIGLMYASDYGYATSPENWTTNLSSYNGAAPKSTNWMYMGDYDWTISRRSDLSNSAVTVDNTGSVSNGGVHGYKRGVRPSFFLESSVVLTGGTGTMIDPYRMN